MLSWDDFNQVLLEEDYTKKGYLTLGIFFGGIFGVLFGGILLLEVKKKSYFLPKMTNMK